MDVVLFVPSLLGLFGAMGLLAYGLKALTKGRKRHLPPPPPQPKIERKTDPVEALRKIGVWMKGEKKE